MKMSDTVHIPAPPEVVWRGLNDPDVLKAAIPACKSIEKLSDTEFKASAAVAVGPVKASFGGKVTLSELDPPHGYRISGEGTGGAAGFAKGAAVVRLTPKDGGTDLAYEVDASVGGKLAQIGQRFIDQAAKKMADEFFARFGDVVSSSLSAATEPEPIGEPVPVEPTPTAPAVPQPAREAGPAPAAREAPSTPTAPPPRPHEEPQPHKAGATRWLIFIAAVAIVTILWIIQFLYLG